MRVAAAKTAKTPPAPVQAKVPPPRPADPQHKYFAVIGGKRIGPMPYAALKRLASEEKIVAQTLLWRKGLGEWLPAAQVADVSSLFGVAPPPLPRPPALKPPPLKASAPVQEMTKAAADAVERVVDEARLTTLPEDFSGKVKGAVLDRFTQMEPDEEPTDQEVDIEDVDHAFFAVGERTADVPSPSRDIGEIELSDGPMFPMEMEAQHVEKDARTSLKDFSVMVSLSRRSRRKSVFAIVALAVVSFATIVLIFTFGDPMGWKGAERTEVEWNPEGHKGFLADRPEGKRERVKEEVEQAPQVAGVEADGGEDPEELIRKMEQAEWKVSLDEEEMAVDREQLASKMGSGKQNNSATKRHSGSSKAKPHGSKKASPRDDDGEMSLEEFANRHALSKDEAGSAFAAGSGGAKGLENRTVGKGMESAMGPGLDGSRKLAERKVVANVKERVGDGSALKALVGRRVSKKVGAERNRIKSCMDRFSSSYTGPGGQLKAGLHFDQKGRVARVSIQGGGPDLEKCFAEIFSGWQISTITRKIKIPIAVRFK